MVKIYIRKFTDNIATCQLFPSFSLRAGGAQQAGKPEEKPQNQTAAQAEEKASEDHGDVDQCNFDWSCGDIPDRSKRKHKNHSNKQRVKNRLPTFA